MQVPALSVAAGDSNHDGTVDAADYAAWRKSASTFGGDPNGYNIWRANFGRTASFGSGSTAPGSAGGVSNVPEPATIALMTVAATITTFWRRRSARQALNALQQL